MDEKEAEARPVNGNHFSSYGVVPTNSSVFPKTKNFSVHQI